MVELHEGYNFVNWPKDWFGLVCELQVIKVRYSETVYSFTLSQKLLSPKTASKLTCGPFLSMFWSFHEMAILELLFPMKFSTTLLKVAPPCKVSKLDFLIGQTRSL
jgi:hypothetical protein